jgi:hypothetical protein
MLTPSASIPSSLLATPREGSDTRVPRSAPPTRRPSRCEQRPASPLARAETASWHGSSTSEQHPSVPHAYSGQTSSLKQAGASAFSRQRHDSLIDGHCPVHSYASAISERPHTAGTFAKSNSRCASPHTRTMMAVPHSYEAQRSYLRRSGATAFPKARSRSKSPNPCLVHSYSGQISTLNRSGATAFPKDKSRSKGPSSCLVHSYSSQLSTLNRSGATAFPKDRSRSKSPNPCLVHSYSGQISTLNRSGATAFPKDRSRSKSPDALACKIHAYSGAPSTLKSTGAGAFGRMPARPDHVLAIASLSRTGLLVTSSASRRPSTAPLRSHSKLYRHRPPSTPALLRTPQHRVAPPRPQSASVIAQRAPSTRSRDSSTTELMIFSDFESVIKHEPALAPDMCFDLKISAPDDLPTTKVTEEDPSPTSIIASPAPRAAVRGSRAPIAFRNIEAALTEARASVASPAA